MVQPAWSYKSEGTIWRLVPMDSGLLVGEARNIEAKQTSFFCLNMQSGKILWEGVTFNEQWWIGIEAAYRDRLLLHGFLTPNMPGHKGIVAVDITTGRVAWENSEIRFILCSDDAVFASNEMPNGLMIHQLDLLTGKIRETRINRSEPLEAAWTQANGQTSDDAPVFPRPLELFETADGRILDVLQKYCPMESVVGSIEVVVMSDQVLFSYHERENKETDSAVRNVLSVANLTDGNIEFTTTLIAGALSVVPDSFFVVRNMLYYIKDRSSIVALRLSDRRK